MLSPLHIMGVFVLALSLRIGYALVCYMYLGTEGLMGADSYGYLINAQYLADGGTIMQVGSAAVPGIDVNVMPIALLLMSLTLASGIDLALAPLMYVLLQGFIDALTCVLIGLLAYRINNKLFLLAGVLAAANPTQIVLSGMVYTDTLFLFFATAGLLLIIKWLQGANVRLALLAGFFWGLALMTRSFVQYWLLVLPVMMVAFSFILHKRWEVQRALHVLVAAVIVVGIASPIAYRNYTQFNTVSLSAQTGAHLLFWVTPLVREYADGTPREVSKARGDLLYQQWDEPKSENPFETSQTMSVIAKAELMDLGGGAIVSAWVKGAVLNVLSPAAVISPPVSSLPRTNFFGTRGENLEDKVWNYLFHNEGASYAMILLVSGLTMPVWVAFGIGGMVSGLRLNREVVVPILLLVAWCGFTLALNGPVISPKYRLPLEPAWIVFTAMGLFSLWRWGRGKYVAQSKDGAT